MVADGLVRVSSDEMLFINLTDQPATVECVQGTEHFSSEQGADAPRVIQPRAFQAHITFCRRAVRSCINNVQVHTERLY